MLTVQSNINGYQLSEDSHASKLICDLKEKGHRRLMAVRVDFLFREEYQQQITIFDILEFKNRLWKNRRGKPSIFKHCLGWIWKLEYTPDAGYHCHCLFIFDADEVQADTYYGELIGQYWMAITQGMGCYNNCNRDKQRYRHCGIGRIHLNNPEEFHNLCHWVITYLNKEDPYIRTAIAQDAAALGVQAGRVRTFGYSNNFHS